MRILFFFILFSISYLVRAQYPYYRVLTFKTNLLSFVNLAVEAPIYNRLTTELSFRKISYDLPGENHEKQSARFNLKYHFPRTDSKERDYSIYIVSGLNLFQNKATFETDEQGKLDVDRIIVGLGTKKRRFDVWLAFEYTVNTRLNNYISNSSDKPWYPKMGISGGIALNLFHIKLKNE